jgi:RimJ/RimL family protein N-acetyltransferase
MTRAVVTLRPAAPGDRARVLEWSNDPAARAASFDSAPIAPDAHAAWYASSLAGARQLFIAEQDASAVGLARLERIDATTAEVGLVLAAEWRGRGLALPVLEALCDAATATGFARLVARVRNDNPRSLHTFARAGFARDGEETVNAATATRFVLALSAARRAHSR